MPRRPADRALNRMRFNANEKCSLLGMRCSEGQVSSLKVSMIHFNQCLIPQYDRQTPKPQINWTSSAAISPRTSFPVTYVVVVSRNGGAFTSGSGVSFLIRLTATDTRNSLPVRRLSVLRIFLPFLVQPINASRCLNMETRRSTVRSYVAA